MSDNFARDQIDTPIVDAAKSDHIVSLEKAIKNRLGQIAAQIIVAKKEDALEPAQTPEFADKSLIPDNNTPAPMSGETLNQAYGVGNENA